MSGPRSRAQRLTALIIAVVLIGGGAAGLGTAHQIPLTTIGSAVAILTGLYFLRIATQRPAHGR